MILMKSVDPEELKYYWQEWYNIAGKPMRGNFENHIPLKNEVARANGEKQIVRLLAGGRVSRWNC